MERWRFGRPNSNLMWARFGWCTTFETTWQIDLKTTYAIWGKYFFRNWQDNFHNVYKKIKVVASSENILWSIGSRPGGQGSRTGWSKSESPSKDLWRNIQAVIHSIYLCITLSLLLIVRERTLTQLSMMHYPSNAPVDRSLDWEDNQRGK